MMLYCVQEPGRTGGVDWENDPRRFDLEHYRVVLFDQRGSGDSTPSSSLVDNTTHHLIEDIERIRSHLQIEKWCVGPTLPHSG